VNELNIGELGKIRYDNVGLLEVEYPFSVGNDKIVTTFLYDVVEGKFIDATLDGCLKFEIEPNDHIMFQLVCNHQDCDLEIYYIDIITQTRWYGNYEQEEIADIRVNKVYSVNFDRHRFRSFVVDEDAPDILRFILAYLIPIDLPYNHFNYSDVNEIVDKIKQFFSS
jgi:hypothetical protein